MSKVLLPTALQQIDRAFKIDKLLEDFDRNFTVNYYTQSEWGYRSYHSQENAVHMAINSDGIYDPKGFYGQALAVKEQIQTLQVQTVLEVGSGKGFNSIFLAQNHPQIEFTGLDLTPLHVKIAQEKSQTLNNLQFQIGNFNQLPFTDRSFDLIFAVECLCHANPPTTALAEIYRALKPGGRLMIFDAWRRPHYQTLDPALQTATQLCELSMAVCGGFTEEQVWLETANNLGFQHIQSTDLTCAVLPTMVRLQTLAQKYFNSRHWTRLFSFMLPKYLVRNAIAGLLMPITCDPHTGSLSYHCFILEKPHQ